MVHPIGLLRTVNGGHGNRAARGVMVSGRENFHSIFRDKQGAFCQKVSKGTKLQLRSSDVDAAPYRIGLSVGHQWSCSSNCLAT